MYNVCASYGISDIAHLRMCLERAHSDGNDTEEEEEDEAAELRTAQPLAQLIIDGNIVASAFASAVADTAAESASRAATIACAGVAAIANGS